VPTAFVVHPSLPAKTVKEFIAIARARPGEIFYSTAGIGTVGHLCAEMLNSIAKIKLTGVHYKGSGPSMIDLVAGHVQTQFPSMPAAVQYVRTGQAAHDRADRQPALGRCPRCSDHGRSRLKGFVVSSGFAMFAPAGTPRPIIDRVHAAMVKALNDPAVKDNLANQGAEGRGEHARGARRLQQGRDREMDQGGERCGHRAGVTGGNVSPMTSTGWASDPHAAWRGGRRCALPYRRKRQRANAVETGCAASSSSSA
jgi:hypothetical protein